MKKLSGYSALWVLVLCTGAVLSASETAGKKPPAFIIASPIDRILVENLSAQGLRPAPLCSDEVFLRRVYIDVTGTLPEPWLVQSFARSTDTDKRSRLIDTLLKTDAYVDYVTMRWCDVLRVKAEYPINLWPNGVHAYGRWLRQAIKNNMPYDQFARALLTSSGSNFREPAVNFYRALQGEKPETLAAGVALTFMGVRIDAWSTDKRKDFTYIFSRVAFKHTAEWKEFIVYANPIPYDVMHIRFPDATQSKVDLGSDPRRAFVDWLITEKNQWFTRNMVNRAWFWLLGRGLIHEVDDIRPDNPPRYEQILKYLQQEFVKSKYDMRQLYRIILNSSTYQQSALAYDQQSQGEELFAHYIVRRLDAEVLLDALCWLTGTREEYSSAIPEPFTFIPTTQRTVQLLDGSISSQFLKMFGRPARDTGLASERSLLMTREQRLHLLNSTHIKNKIEKGWRLKSLYKKHARQPRILSRELYKLIVSRVPSVDEEKMAVEILTAKGAGKQAAVDIAWALINSKDFLYRH